MWGGVRCDGLGDQTSVPKSTESPSPFVQQHLVQLLRVARHVGHHEAGVGPPRGVLGLDDHPPRPVPAGRRVGERAEEPLRLARATELPLGPLGPVARRSLQHRVAGQAEHVADTVAIAPPHRPPAAEAAVGPDRDLDLRPSRPQPPDQELQHRPGMPARVDVAGPQVGHQQVIAAEDVQRQVAVVVVVAVEEAALLMAVDRVVGGVEVEDQRLGRAVMAGDELIGEHAGDADQGGAVDAVLQAAEGRGGCQRRVGLGRASGGQLQRRVAAEGQVVVEVLVAAGDGGDALGEQGLLVVRDEFGPAGVGDGRVEGLEEAEAAFDLAEQQGTGVGGEPTAVEVGDDGPGSEPRKVQGVEATVCHSGGLALGGSGCVLTQTLQGVGPSRNSSARQAMQYPG
jgi:hypothetical protein